MTKPKLGEVVMYHPNENDNQSRPKNEPVPAIVVGYSKKTVPVEKDEKGQVTKSKEVDAVNLQVFQDGPSESILHRTAVVEKSDAESESLKYKLNYYVAETATDNSGAISTLNSQVNALASKVAGIETATDNSGAISTLNSQVNALASKVAGIETAIASKGNEVA